MHHENTFRDNLNYIDHFYYYLTVNLTLYFILLLSYCFGVCFVSPHLPGFGQFVGFVWDSCCRRPSKGHLRWTVMILFVKDRLYQFLRVFRQTHDLHPRVMVMVEVVVEEHLLTARAVKWAVQAQPRAIPGAVAVVQATATASQGKSGTSKLLGIRSYLVMFQISLPRPRPHLLALNWPYCKPYLQPAAPPALSDLHISRLIDSLQSTGPLVTDGWALSLDVWVIELIELGCNLLVRSSHCNCNQVPDCLALTQTNLLIPDLHWTHWRD